jgi:hypothetical protein
MVGDNGGTLIAEMLGVSAFKPNKRLIDKCRRRPELTVRFLISVRQTNASPGINLATSTQHSHGIGFSYSCMFILEDKRLLFVVGIQTDVCRRED